MTMSVRGSLVQAAEILLKRNPNLHQQQILFPANYPSIIGLKISDLDHKSAGSSSDVGRVIAHLGRHIAALLGSPIPSSLRRCSRSWIGIIVLATSVLHMLLPRLRRSSPARVHWSQTKIEDGKFLTSLSRGYNSNLARPSTQTQLLVYATLQIELVVHVPLHQSIRVPPPPSLDPMYYGFNEEGKDDEEATDRESEDETEGGERRRISTQNLLSKY